MWVGEWTGHLQGSARDPLPFRDAVQWPDSETPYLSLLTSRSSFEGTGPFLVSSPRTSAVTRENPRPCKSHVRPGRGGFPGGAATDGSKVNPESPGWVGLGFRVFQIWRPYDSDRGGLISAAELRVSVQPRRCEGRACSPGGA